MQHSAARDIVVQVIELIKAEREVNHFKINAGPGLLEAESTLERVAQDLQILLMETIE